MRKKSFETIAKIQSVLKIWRMWCLTLQVKIKVFKILAISKIVYLSVINKILNEIIVEFIKSKNDSSGQLTKN